LLSNSVPTAFGAVGIPVKAVSIELGLTDPKTAQ
jgi:lactate permease